MYNGIPLLSYDDDKLLMLHYIHDDGILSYQALHNKGIRTITLKKHWKAERAKYKFKATPLTKKPAPRKRPGRKPTFFVHHDTTQSRDKIDCMNSVIEYYLHRDESHQDAPG